MAYKVRDEDLEAVIRALRFTAATDERRAAMLKPGSLSKESAMREANNAKRLADEMEAEG